jgi:2,4-dichlorophenol 6-monooxygenase
LLSGNNIFRQVGPERPTNLPLLRSEPIWKQIAEIRSPGDIRFSHKVIDFDQNENFVTLKVEGPDGGAQLYRAQYVVAAEGGKGIFRPKLGIEMEGPTDIVDIVSVHFKADLSRYWDDRTLIANFINPEGETLLGSGALIQLGPTWGRYSEEWGLHFGLRLDDPARFTEDDSGTLGPRIRDLLRIPDLDIEILKVSHWVVERVLANRYSVGRIFLAGDAAHRSTSTYDAHS